MTTASIHYLKNKAPAQSSITQNACLMDLCDQIASQINVQEVRQMAHGAEVLMELSRRLTIDAAEVAKGIALISHAIREANFGAILAQAREAS